MLDKSVVRRIYLRACHRGGFRPEEWGDVVGVYSVTPPGMTSRICYAVRYSDGVTDYVPILDNEFELSTAPRKNAEGVDVD